MSFKKFWGKVKRYRKAWVDMQFPVISFYLVSDVNLIIWHIFFSAKQYNDRLKCLLIMSCVQTQLEVSVNNSKQEDQSENKIWYRQLGNRELDSVYFPLSWTSRPSIRLIFGCHSNLPTAVFSGPIHILINILLSRKFYLTSFSSPLIYLT